MQQMSRRQAFEALKTEIFDVAVIGGGITGAGIARDAALRGLRVALFEKFDFGSGTSSKSSKLIHGGLRYLQHAEFGLVFESVTERTTLFKRAPHLVRPLRFLLPTYEGQFPGRFTLGCGMWMYDALSKFSAPGRHRNHGRDAVAKLEPRLRREGLTGGVVFYDGITDDARLVLETILDAQAASAQVFSYVHVDGFLKDANSDIKGVCVTDSLEPKNTAEVRARVTVNAAGAWSDRMARLSDSGEFKPILRPTKGVHIVVEAERLPVQHAVVMPVHHDGRIIFAIPWTIPGCPAASRTVIGTTDTDFFDDPDDVRADSADVAYLLKAVDHYFPGCLALHDVLSVWAGVRPLVMPDQEGLSTSGVSREHQILGKPGLLRIVGGKLTTYRRMAADVLTQVYVQLGIPEPPCTTDERPFPGAVGLVSETAGDDPLAPLIDELLRKELPFVNEQVAWHLATTYGVRSRAIVEDVANKLADGDTQVADWIDPDFPCLLGEVDHAVTAELALCLDDVLSRRLPLSTIGRGQGLPAVQLVASRMAVLLGWSQQRTEAEIERYHRCVARERRTQDGFL